MAAAGFMIFFLIAPSPCADVPQCVDALSGGSELLGNSGISRAGALCVLFLKEVFGVAFAHREFKNDGLAQLGFRNPTKSLVVMCLTIGIKATSEVAMAFGFTWAHAVPPSHGFNEDWGGVETLRYCDWLVTVPLLLVLSGHFLLQRPISEVVRPIVVTNAYMYISWVALMVDSSPLRIVFVAVAFVGYLCASFQMCWWAHVFLRETSPETPRRLTRVFLLAFLVASFGVYGVVYLLALTGVISNAVEAETYGRGDFVVKLGMSCVLATVNAAERQRELGGLVIRYSSLSSAYGSLLRRNFDHVWRCSLDKPGCLRIVEDSTDVTALEALLRKPVSGAIFNGLIATERDRVRFEDYVIRSGQTRISRTNSTWVSECSEDVAECSMGDQFSCDLVSYNCEGLPERTFACTVYLSAVADGPDHCVSEQQMVIALDLVGACRVLE
jgi:bacteriorhodopsin